nr:MAG TPA: hypothetical protein [Caudoviricetes sp.]
MRSNGNLLSNKTPLSPTTAIQGGFRISKTP